jgi:16S rRNA (guanine527-N7)-methyltransferase
VSRLGLDNVEVVRARAEELHGQARFQVVTSRAVAPLGRLLDWSMPLVEAGGAMLAMKGTTAADEVERAGRQLRRHRAGEVSVLEVGGELLDPPTTLVRVAAAPADQVG